MRLDYVLNGRVAAGLGTAPTFTALPWVMEALSRALGAEPYPGTLNLAVQDSPTAWPERWEGLPVIPLPGQDGMCDSLLYPVRIAETIPGLAVLPLIPGYPPGKLELVAPVHVRRTLGLTEGDPVTVSPAPAPVLAGCKAVLFDVDGTLINSAEAYYQILCTACAETGLTAPDRTVVPLLMNQNVQAADLLFRADEPDRQERMARLGGAIKAAWPRIFPALAELMPDAPEVLSRLRERGIRLGVVTSSGRRVLAPLAEVGLDTLLEVVVTADDRQPRKPDPAPLLLALARLDLGPREVAYVGDTPLDIAAARAAGMPAIGVTTGTADRELLGPCQPDLVIDSLRWLPGSVAGGEGEPQP